MANHKSAIKRHRQSLTRRTRNRLIKTNLRSLVKVARVAAASNDKKGAQEALRAAESAIANPCRLTPATQPLKNDRANAPTAGAAYKKPNALAPPNETAIAGNNAVGMPNIIAIKSTT